MTTATEPDLPANDYLTAAAICHLAGGITDRTLAYWIKAGQFPKPEKYKGKHNRRYWPADQVRTALAARTAGLASSAA